MKCNVIGIERDFGSGKDEKGTFSWDNILLHVADDDSSPITKMKMLAGRKVSVVKMKNDFDKLVYIGDPKIRAVVTSFTDLLGCLVEVFVDPNTKKVECISVLSIDA